ncbi:MAG TPA: hypothetical protein VGA15_22330 [Bradyrhizobium sp.]
MSKPFCDESHPCPLSRPARNGRWPALGFPTNCVDRSPDLVAVDLPAGFTIAEAPVGVEMVVSKVGYAFEQATHHRLPPQSMPGL